MDRPPSPVRFPYITIEYCTQCKWLLRAAYFAQEILSTFSTSLGEVSLRPSTGGIFVVELHSRSSTDGAVDNNTNIQRHILWDRKVEGGFPETKELKRRLRDVIDPTRNLGHVDGHSKAIPTLDSTSAYSPSSSARQSTMNALPHPAERIEAMAPIPKALNRLQADDQSVGIVERKLTSMDVDIKSRPVFRNENGDGVNVRGKTVVGDEMGFCRPGDEDCG